MRRGLLTAVVLLGVLPCHLPARVAVAQQALPERVVKCTECGMNAKVDNRFTSRVVQGGSTLYFCDIGDLAAFIERTRPKKFAASVHDFRSGEWIEVGRAFFVIEKKIFSSPMGWGIAAFRDREGAIGMPMDFEALRKTLR